MSPVSVCLQRIDKSQLLQLLNTVKIIQMAQYNSNIDYMDVFNFLTFSASEQSQLFSISSEKSEQFEVNQFERCDLLENKKELPTSEIISLPLAKIPAKKEEKGLESVNSIDFQWEVKNRNQSVRQGTKNDTVELNINFKTIIFNHFKELLLANELSQQEARSVLDYGARSPSFKSLSAFCAIKQGNEGISKLCIRFIESSEIIRRVLQSRCKVLTKIQMIKFVEILRTNIQGSGEIKKWKHALKK